LNIKIKHLEIMKTTTYTLVKFNFETEINQVNQKAYATKQDAENSGNSWKRDCTVDQNIRRGRWFEIVEIN